LAFLKFKSGAWSGCSARCLPDEVNGFVLDVLAQHIEVVAKEKLVQPHGHLAVGHQSLRTAKKFKQRARRPIRRALFVPVVSHLKKTKAASGEGSGPRD
jgi:hypothetical protein